MKNDKINLEELNDFLNLIEAQRDLAYHLQKFKEATEQRVKELEIIKNKAQLVYNLKSSFRNVLDKYKQRLTDEEIKKINVMLQQRHINVGYVKK